MLNEHLAYALRERAHARKVFYFDISTREAAMLFLSVITFVQTRTHSVSSIDARKIPAPIKLKIYISIMLKMFLVSLCCRQIFLALY